MQNINLYQRERRTGGGPRVRHMGLGAAIVAVALAAHSAWLGWQLHSVSEFAEVAEQQAQQAEASLSLARADFQEPTLDPLLPQQLTALEAENRELQRLTDYLKALDAQRSAGFAALLQGLADRHPPQGLWLTRIRLQAGGDALSLQGLTQDQELLPLYLQSLGQSSAFSGRDFARFDLQRDDRDLLRFRLSSQAVAEQDDE